CHGDRPGELNLAGVCLAREYLRDPDMTLRRRLYRTGDKARWRGTTKALNCWLPQRGAACASTTAPWIAGWRMPTH
ncbi:hypothetical protein, partial [Pseudomonas aeruginosa]